MEGQVTDPSPSSDTAAFVARQPVFTEHRLVHGYDLLFRAGPENVFPAVDGDLASAELISGSVATRGWAELTGNKLAFINFTKRLLTGDFALLLPRDRCVIEILEDVEADEEVLASCRMLRRHGYTLALDDAIVPDDRFHAFAPLVDLVKADFRLASTAQRRQLADAAHAHRLTLLAEKVETPAEFAEGRDLGFTLFQGNLLEPAMVMTGRAKLGSYAPSVFSLLQAAARPDYDLHEVEAVVQQDLSLTYRTLRFANSASVGRVSGVTSVRDALVLMGQREVARLASLLALTSMAEGRPPELAVSSLVRARTLELLAPHLGLGTQGIELFLVGMLSRIDAILGRTMREAVEQLPVAAEVANALLGRPSPLRDALALVAAHESAQWREAQTRARRLQLDSLAVAQSYLQAVRFADDLLGDSSQTGGMPSTRAAA